MPLINEQLLTAYALDELPAAEKAKVDAYLVIHPEAAVAVEAIRMTARQLGDELMTELQDAPAVRIQRPVPARRNWRTPAALAASVALVAGTYLALVSGKQQPTGNSVLVKSVTSITDLKKQSVALTRQQRYAEALVVIDQILAIDPQDSYANGVKLLVQDKANLQEARDFRPNHDYTFTKQLNRAEEGKIPYDDILRYPADWNTLLNGPNSPAPGAIKDSESATYKPTTPAGSLTLDASPTHAQDQVLSLGGNSMIGTGAGKKGEAYSFGAGGSGDGWAAKAPFGTPQPSSSTYSGSGTVVAGTVMPGKPFHGTSVAATPPATPVATGIPLPTLQPGQTSTQTEMAESGQRFRTGQGQADPHAFRGTTVGAPADRFISAPRNPDSSPGTESYDRITDNPFLDVAGHPLSTFSIDVDTASYSNLRRFLNNGQLPPRDAVRIEEMVNYFPYSYDGPKEADKPFASSVEIAACPWNTQNRLVRVGIKGRDMAAEQRPASNLVFLIDVSGSMNAANKLPLVKQSLRELVNKLDGRDRVAIVVYAGNSGLVLPSTAVGGEGEANFSQLWQRKYEPMMVRDKEGKSQNEEAVRKAYAEEILAIRDAQKQQSTILNAIDNLQPGGSTNGAAGIELAYQTAQSAFIKDGVNRVILATDGDFNVGITDQGALTKLIEEKAKGGVFLSVLGFGMGNTKDSTMEKLADKGNGNYAYIDNLAEAKKVLVEQMNGTLVTIAKDVKIQVEFNPAKVAGYRLIGYENRLLAKEDFNDDKKDAGEIGAGHTVTALYEVVPAGVAMPTTQPGVDPLKYKAKPAANDSPEMLTLKLRYKAPDAPADVQGTSKLLEFPITDAGKGYAQASGDFKFAAAVAGFGMILRDSPHKGTASYASVLELAGEGKGEDPNGYRAEFLQLVEQAKRISGK